MSEGLKEPGVSIRPDLALSMMLSMCMACVYQSPRKTLIDIAMFERP